jgi:hypothetical protein
MLKEIASVSSRGTWKAFYAGTEKSDPARKCETKWWGIKSDQSGRVLDKPTQSKKGV